MKHFIVIITMLLLGFAAQAQTTATKKPSKPNVEMTDDGNFKATPRTTAMSTATKTDKTYTDRDGQVFPVYVSKNGKYFVVKTSKKSGKKYNYYLNLPGEK